MKRILHAGAGPIIIRQPGVDWVNIDICDFHKPDFVLDYTKDLVATFGENAFDGLLAIHTLEHVLFPQGVEAALNQFYRVLKPGGVCRILVPDLMLVANKYVAGESLRDIYDGPFHEGPDFPATRFQYFCRAWSHSVLFDRELLSHFLVGAGFIEIHEPPFNISEILELCGHDRFQSESLILSAQKP